MTDQIRNIPVLGRFMRVRIAGDPSKPTVLMLHGVTRSLDDWDLQFDELADQFHLIAPDMPGYGWSAPHPDGAGLAALARGVGELLDVLDLRDPVHVVGNSLGGAVTMTLLTQRPELVASMTLLDPAGFGSEVTPLLRLLGIPVIGKIAATTASLPSAIIQERLVYTDKSFATRKRIQHALTIARETNAGLTSWRTVAELGSFFSGVSAQWRTELLTAVAEYDRPMLVVWGDNDKVLPPSHLAAAAIALPKARTTLIPGIGHMPHIECAPECAALISDVVTGSITSGASTP